MAAAAAAAAAAIVDVVDAAAGGGATAAAACGKEDMLSCVCMNEMAKQQAWFKICLMDR